MIYLFRASSRFYRLRHRDHNGKAAIYGTGNNRAY
jgi:hypothetical protein